MKFPKFPRSAADCRRVWWREVLPYCIVYGPYASVISIAFILKPRILEMQKTRRERAIEKKKKLDAESNKPNYPDPPGTADKHEAAKTEKKKPEPKSEDPKDPPDVQGGTWTSA